MAPSAPASRAKEKSESRDRALMLGRAVLRSRSTAVLGARCFSSLTPKIDKFAADVTTHLPADGKGVAFASAWLTTDNVIV